MRRVRFAPLALSPAALIMAANWAAYGANAVSLIVSARALGAAGRGSYSAILVWSMTCASICDLSLGPALARALTIGHPAGHLRRFLPRALLGAALAATALMVIFLNTFLARTVPDGAGIAISLTIAPALVLSSWGVYFFQGLADQVRYALARMLPPVICTGLVIVQALDHLTLHGLLASLSLGYWLVGMWSALIAWHYVSTGSSSPSPLAGEGRGGGSLLSYGLRAHLGTLASIANARLDLMLLTLIVPLTAVGNYALAVSLTTPIAIVGGGLAAANFRRIGIAASSGGAIIRSVWRGFFLPTLGLACVPASAAFLIPHVVGHEFDAAVLPTVILSIGTCGFGAIYLGTNILQARGLPGTSSLLSLAAALLSAVTLLLLVPRYGIVGAAVSSALTYLVVGASCILVTLRVSPKPTNLLPAALAETTA